MRSSVAKRKAVLEKAISDEFRSERELVLRCARTRIDSRTANRIRELLRGEIDWVYARRLAARHGVSTLLYLSLRDTCPELVPDPVIQEMRARFHASGIAVHELVREYGELSGRLAKIGIHSMLIKGPALAAAAYGDLARRKPGDLDLLIRKSDFGAASEILRDGGYTVDTRHQNGLQFTDIPDLIETRKGVTFHRGPYAVDLHWTLDDFPIPTNLDLDRIWRRKTTVAVGDLEVSALSVEDHLQFLACHGAKHNWSRVSMVCDIAELVRSSPKLDWSYLLQQAKDSRRERMLFLALVLAADLLDAHLPEPVHERLKQDWTVRYMAGRVAKSLFEDASDLHVHALRLVLLEKMSEKARYLAHRWVRSH